MQESLEVDDCLAASALCAEGLQGLHREWVRWIILSRHVPAVCAVGATPDAHLPFPVCPFFAEELQSHYTVVLPC